MEIERIQAVGELAEQTDGVDVVAVMPSEEGPKLFINREMYLLKDDCWDLEMFTGRNRSLFIFYWKGEVKLSIKCSPQSDFLKTLETTSVEPLYFFHNRSVAGSSAPTHRMFSWSSIEAFFVMIYQCLSKKTRSASFA